MLNITSSVRSLMSSIHSPHLTFSESGELVLEYWEDDHKLTVYVIPADITIVRAWGADVFTEMADESKASLEDFQKSYRWLNKEDKNDT